MAVLSHQSILRRCNGGLGSPSLLTNFDAAQVRTAAYDLRVGYEYYVDDPKAPTSGGIEIGYLGSTATTLQIAANQVVLVRTLEDVVMPADLVGHLSLKLDVLLKGIIMASQSQIDAGYVGPIFALLYNLSQDTVPLSQGQSFLRLEFAELDEKTELIYAGDFKPHFRLFHVVRERLTSSLEGTNRVAREALAKVERRTRIAVFGAFGVFVTALIAILAMLWQLIGPVQGQASDARSTAERIRDEYVIQKSHLVALERRITQLEAELDAARTPSDGSVQGER